MPPDDSGLGASQLASDGRRVATQRTVDGNGDVWLIDVTVGTNTRFTFDAAIDNIPVWSPDGARSVFRSARNGRFDLFEKPSDAAGDEQPLLVTPQDKAPTDWSPDGRVLLFAAQDPKTASDLWGLPLVGDRKPFPLVQSRFEEVGGQFSPDGRWVAYASDETGRYEIYIRPFPGPGGKWQVSIAGGIHPRWGPDGREIFYLGPDNRLIAVPIEVSADGRALSPAAPVGLFATRMATGGNAPAAGYASRAQYAVTRDGRFLMNVEADDAAPAPITVVLNWDAALTR